MKYTKELIQQYIELRQKAEYLQTLKDSKKINDKIRKEKSK